jgi:hypothetical protein
MVKGGMGFMNGIPVDIYDLSYYVTIQIKNPTSHPAVLKMYGEAQISVSYLALADAPRSFDLKANQTQDFTIPAYSLNYYNLLIFRTEKLCDVPSSINATMTNVVVNELHREPTT